MESPFNPAYPTIFFVEDNISSILMKMNPAVKSHEAVKKIEDVFNIVPSSPFNDKFVEEAYSSNIASEIRIGKLVGFFSALAIIISCLGLIVL